MNTIKPITIAVDFDGTCVSHEFPVVGNDIGAVPVLKRLIEAGHKLILFTMRSNKSSVQKGTYNVSDAADYLEHAVSWFIQNDIPLFGVNSNPHQKSWTDSPKAFANIYIDDAFLECSLKWDPNISERPFVNWGKVETKLELQGLLPLNMNKLSMDDADLPELIAKVHESIEGRYDLTASDEYDIHHFLCKLQ